MTHTFISYSRDSDEHTERVYALANKLRSDGVAVTIDRDMLPGGPAEGWPQWITRQVAEVDRVLVVCSALYFERYTGNLPAGTGLGATLEAAAIRQHPDFKEKIRAIIFDHSDLKQVPAELKQFHVFSLITDEGYAELLRWLQGSIDILSPTQAPTSAIRWPEPDDNHSWLLANRQSQVEAFKKLVSGKSSRRIMLLLGATGTGKSVLISQLITYARKLGVRTVSLNLREFQSLSEVFGTLYIGLSQSTRRDVWQDIKVTKLFRSIEDLQSLTEPLVLTFDNYEQALPGVQQWVETQLLPRLSRAPGVIVVIGGRQVPNYVQYQWRELVEVCELGSIKTEEWLKYAQYTWQNTNITSDDIRTLVKVTKGNPMLTSTLLETLDKSVRSDQSSDFPR